MQGTWGYLFVAEIAAFKRVNAIPTGDVFEIIYDPQTRDLA